MRAENGTNHDKRILFGVRSVSTHDRLVPRYCGQRHDCFHDDYRTESWPNQRWCLLVLSRDRGPVRQYFRYSRKRLLSFYFFFFLSQRFFFFFYISKRIYLFIFYILSRISVVYCNTVTHLKPTGTFILRAKFSVSLKKKKKNVFRLLKLIHC